MATTHKIVIAGISTLALAAIPAALALGASGWLGFTITAHGFERTIQQEKRRAVYVAAPAVPTKAAMAFDISASGPVIVERADLDGDTLTAYLRNRSGRHQCFQQLHWAMKAPDGTIISAGEGYIGDAEGGLEPGDRVEGIVKLGVDRRAMVLRLKVSAQEACG